MPTTPLPNPLAAGDYTGETYTVSGTVTVSSNTAAFSVFFDTGSVVEDTAAGADIDTFLHSGSTAINFENGAELLASVPGGLFTIGSDTEHQLFIEGAGDTGYNGSSVTTPGSILVDNGDTLHLDLRGLVNDGIITVNGGTLLMADVSDPEPIKVSGSGSVLIENGSTVEINAAFQPGQSFNFTGTNNILQLDDVGSANPTSFGGTIDSFAASDEIVIHGQSGTNAAVVGSTLVVSNSSGTIAEIALSGVSGSFNATTVGGNTVVTLACFASGTRLRSASGDIAVENLTIGDAMQVENGEVLPVTWIGRRRVECARLPQPEAVWPVVIAADAFAPGVPARDLSLSPDHAIYTDGVFVLARDLVNGSTVRQVPVAAVTYWHVELPRHAVLLAEGLTVESYLDTGNRSAFANAGPVVAMRPDFASTAARPCAPLVTDGPALAAIRSALDRCARRLARKRRAA